MSRRVSDEAIQILGVVGVHRDVNPLLIGEIPAPPSVKDFAVCLCPQPSVKATGLAPTQVIAAAQLANPLNEANLLHHHSQGNESEQSRAGENPYIHAPESSR